MYNKTIELRKQDDPRKTKVVAKYLMKSIANTNAN